MKKRPFIHPPNTPRAIEHGFNCIYGDLICSICYQVIYRHYQASPFEPDLKTIKDIVEGHICPKIRFKYDFDSPLTIAEQYKQAKECHDNIQAIYKH
jgi:hypothetical protein